MEQNKQTRYAQKAPSRGGARPGAGRKKGSTNKVSLEDLLESIELQVGVPYAEQLASNYAGAIGRADWSRVENYDRAFLNKVVADKQQVETIESDEATAQKALAFAEALTALTTVNNKGK